jgi:hypothetical protein
MEDLNVLEMHYRTTQSTTVPQLGRADQAIAHMLTKTEVSNLFFSDLNMGVVQAAIAKSVLTVTGKQIGAQSEPELFLIMRSIYLQYGRNGVDSTVAEVRALNQRVVEYCVDVVVANLTQYMRYVQEVGRVPVPHQRPPNLSSAGTKSLELKVL